MRTRHALLLVTLLLTLLLTPATPAAAHAVLRTSAPAEGAVLDTAPREMTLAFSESVALLDGSIRVLSPDNHRVRTAEPVHGPDGDDTVRVGLPGDLSRGTYTVAWRVVSADSHPVSGAFTFSVGEPTPAAAAADPAPPEHPVTTALHNAARYLAYLAVALLLGTAAFAVFCRPPDPGRLAPLAHIGWWTLLATTLALLALRAPYEAGTAPWTALDPDTLSRTLTARPGQALLARLVLLAAAARYLRRALPECRTAAARAAGAALAVGLALTWAAAEHASAGIQVPAAMASSVLHLLAMSVWLGGLAALLRATPAAATTARFSRLALGCVAVLVVTGVYQSWRGLGSYDALTGTSYGRILLAKLAAVTVLLAAASLSRRWTARLVTATATEPAATRSAAKEPAAKEPAAEESTAEEPTGEETTTAAGAATDAVPRTATAAATAPVSAPVSVSVPVRSTAPAAPAALVRLRVPEPAGRPSAETSEPPAEAPQLARGPVLTLVPALAPASAQDLGGGSAPTPGPVPTDTETDTDTATGGPERPSGRAPEQPPGPPPTRLLRRSVLVEATVAVVVLVLTTVLTGTVPGRAAQEAVGSVAAPPATSTATVPFDVGIPGGRGTVQVTLDPARVGENSVQAVAFGADGALITVPELRLALTLPAQDVGPIDARVKDRGGYWATDSLDLPLPGTWTVKVTVRVSEVDQISETAPLRVIR